MATRTGTILRLGTLSMLAALIAACAPVEAPRLGSGPPVLSPTAMTTLTKPAATSEVVTFTLDPVTNVPGEMAYAFEDAMKAKAPTRQLKIVDNGPADYRLKAYLSAVGDYSSGFILYAVDVFDSSGKRVHRASGRIRSGGSKVDVWANFKGPAVAGTVAQEVVDDLGNWAHT